MPSSTTRTPPPERYELSPFRPGRSSCCDCGAALLILQPADPRLDLRGAAAFFLCTECLCVSQVGIGRLRGRHGELAEESG